MLSLKNTLPLMLALAIGGCNLQAASAQNVAEGMWIYQGEVSAAEVGFEFVGAVLLATILAPMTLTKVIFTIGDCIDATCKQKVPSIDTVIFWGDDANSLKNGKITQKGYILGELEAKTFGPIDRSNRKHNLLDGNQMFYTPLANLTALDLPRNTKNAFVEITSDVSAKTFERFASAELAFKDITVKNITNVPLFVFWGSINDPVSTNNPQGRTNSGRILLPDEEYKFIPSERKNTGLEQKLNVVFREAIKPFSEIKKLLLPGNRLYSMPLTPDTVQSIKTDEGGATYFKYEADGKPHAYDITEQRAEQAEAAATAAGMAPTPAQQQAVASAVAATEQATQKITKPAAQKPTYQDFADWLKKSDNGILQQQFEEQWNEGHQ